MERLCIALLVVSGAIVSGCGRGDMTAEKVRALADAAMAEHCASNRAACENLRFTGSEKDGKLWLVEYESKTCLYGVIVDSAGSTEITFTSEK